MQVGRNVQDRRDLSCRTSADAEKLSSKTKSLNKSMEKNATLNSEAEVLTKPLALGKAVNDSANAERKKALSSQDKESKERLV